MFQQSTASILPTVNPFVTQNSKPSNYNWKTWAKWGLLSAGGLVLTTAVISYGGPTLVAGLSSLVAGIASRFKESGQETALSLTAQLETQPKPNIVLSKFQEEEERRQDFIQSIEAYPKTKEWEKFVQELGLNEEGFAEENNEDEQIQEFLSPAVAKEQKTTESKLTDFKELLSEDKLIHHQKRDLPPITEGLVAYYPFNGNANDESGYGNHGTVFGATLTTDRFGNPDSAYFFDGIEDWIDLGNDPTVNPNSSVTASAWILLNSYQSQRWTSIVNKFYAYILQIHSSSGLTITIYDNSWAGWWRDTAPNVDFSLGQWYHIVGSFDEQTGEGYIYIDGVNKTIVPRPEGQPTNLYSSSYNLKLGQELSSQWFYGCIDDVRIYDRALSPSEIQVLYNWQSTSSESVSTSSLESVASESVQPSSESVSTSSLESVASESVQPSSESVSTSSLESIISGSVQHTGLSSAWIISIISGAGFCVTLIGCSIFGAVYLWDRNKTKKTINQLQETNMERTVIALEDECDQNSAKTMQDYGLFPARRPASKADKEAIEAVERMLNAAYPEEKENGELNCFRLQILVWLDGYRNIGLTRNQRSELLRKVEELREALGDNDAFFPKHDLLSAY